MRVDRENKEDRRFCQRRQDWLGRHRLVHRSPLSSPAVYLLWGHGTTSGQLAGGPARESSRIRRAPSLGLPDPSGQSIVACRPGDRSLRLTEAAGRLVRMWGRAASSARSGLAGPRGAFRAGCRSLLGRPANLVRRHPHARGGARSRHRKALPSLPEAPFPRSSSWSTSRDGRSGEVSTFSRR